MGDMTPLYSLFALLPILLSGFILYTHRRTYGSLDISTESVAYQRQEYHSLLDWDKYALQIVGRPSLVLAGEFHYWRYPDRSRWEHILQQYRALGFNAIRIYFHWGFHSPDDGVYLFDDNRDVDYLLNLCEAMGIYVLAAPGPYICAESQGGGYPAWLVAKRQLRIRHNKIMLWRTYDPEFASYEVQWMDNILPILARHQITDNTDTKRGCVLGVQIDNELFETMNGILPVGLHDQMRILAKAARDAGITVPLFTNDGFEEGGWIPHRPSNFWSKHPFGIDLYGFDKYVVFAPASSPKSWLIDGDTVANDWQDWDPKTVEKGMDKLEKTVRGYGGGAAQSPMFLPEMQGGWFNHYQLQHTYDQIYDFYGEHLTRILFETSLAQGVTALGVYIPYGGTNWGTLGDPDVYTSYDYSACIREYGYTSSRGRQLRKALLFVQSFESLFARTDATRHPSVTSRTPHVIQRQRVSVDAEQNATFTFFRNFDREKRAVHDVFVNHEGHTFTMGVQFPYRTSFIALGNYTTVNGLHLVQSTLPILARMVQPRTNEEIWFIEPNAVGALAFVDKAMDVTGDMQHPVLQRQDGVSLLRFDKPRGWTKLTTTTGYLYLLGLDKEEAMTIYADFQLPYWHKDTPNAAASGAPHLVAWGADTLYFDKKTNVLQIEQNVHDQKVHVVTWTHSKDARLQPATPQPPKMQTQAQDDDSAILSSPSLGVPYHTVLPLADHHQDTLVIDRPLTHWQARDMQWDKLAWAPLAKDKKGNLLFDAIDYHFTSGHVLYRNVFTTPPTSSPRVQLTLNARHRATVIMNGRILGGHTTYSRQLFMPGAKIGPDPYFLGSRTYDLTPYLSHEGDLNNTLIVLVDSFGLNRQAFIMNDIRNPRGIIKAKLHGIPLSTHPTHQWHIAGVDVRKLSEPFNSAGFPDEKLDAPMASFKPQTSLSGGASLTTIPLDPAQGVQWWQASFSHKVPSKQRIPLCMHLDGEWTGKVFLNGKLIGLYYGNGDGPQHDFYLPDDWVQSSNNVLRILAYAWTPTEAAVAIRGWRTDFPGSGNVLNVSQVDTRLAADYMVWSDQIAF